MRSGFVLPGGTATEQLDLAILAEQAGWAGIFVWEAAYGIITRAALSCGRYVDEPVEKQPMRGITVSVLWTMCGQLENHENIGRKLLCRAADKA